MPHKTIIQKEEEIQYCLKENQLNYCKNSQNFEYCKVKK